MHDIQQRSAANRDEFCVALNEVGGSDEFVLESPVDRPPPGNMPGVDLQSYLLSASPPGFDIHYAMRNPFNGIQNGTSPNKKIHVVSASSGLKICKPFFDGTFNSSSKKKTITSSASRENLRKLTDGVADVGLHRVDSESSLRSEGTLKTKKRVSFADDLGKQLVYIRILTERPSSPPTFQRDFLSLLANGSSAELTDTPPLKLNFTQPASDYIAFREKLEQNYVSLENVILKDYYVMGTIKVKNISFEKTVQARCTFDGWESFTEIPATYVNTHHRAGPFDTFSFEINVSPKLNLHKTVQFAILYEVNGSQYWDNNRGSNYEIVPSSWKDETDSQSNTTDTVVFGLHPSESWTQYCGWTNMSNSVPYW